MKSIYFFFLSLLTLHSANANCGTGTLKCSTDNKPLICDFTQSYVLNHEQNTCIVERIEGCRIPTYNKTLKICFLCDYGKILDTANNKCSNVVAGSIVKNCQKYDENSSNCMSCLPEFYLDNSSCTAIGEKSVPNCASYTSNKDCNSCKNGFYLKDLKCEPFTAASNCWVNSNLKCTECSQNYLLNYGLNPQVETDTNFYNSIVGIKFSSPSFMETNTSIVCENISVKNCSVITSASKCNTCNPGYFLNNSNLCELYPEKKIVNCVLYNSAIDCTACKENYYLSGETCVEVTSKDKCILYDQNTGNCSKCDTDWYLFGLECKERTNNNISNCKENMIDEDVCKTCDAGYSKTGDKLACLIDFANCAEGQQNQASLKTATSHSCSSCVIKFYKKSVSECAPVTNRGVDCSTYSILQNVCTACDNNKYLNPEGTACLLKSILNCETVTDKTVTANKCAKCFNGYSLNNTATSCDEINNKPNCYMSDGISSNCQECNQNFLKQSNTCLVTRDEASFDKNCMSNVSSVPDSDCNKCKANFLIATGGTPILPLDSMPLNCTNLDGQTGKCNQCKGGYVLNSSTCKLSILLDLFKICFQKEVGALGDLNTATNCAVCYPTAPYKLNGSTCEPVDKHNKFLDCADASFQNDDYCQKCSVGFERKKFDALTCVKDITSLKAFKRIKYCDIQDKPNHCMKCVQGKKLALEGKSCQDLGSISHIVRAFDLNLNPKGSLQNHSGFVTVTNCKTNAQMDGTKVGCSECKPNFLAIIQVQAGSSGRRRLAATSAYTLLGQFGAYPVNHTTWNTIIACVPKVTGGNSNAFQLTDGTPSIPASGEESDCEIGFTIDGKAGYGCLKCKGNKVGKVQDLLKESNGTALGPNILGLTDCQNATTMTQTDVGAGYNYRTVTTAPQLNNYVNKTKCGSGVLVYSFTVHATSGAVAFKKIGTSSDISTRKRVADCYIASTETIGGNISNCQVYVLNDSQGNQEAFSSANKINVRCLECMSGYKGVISSNKITSCSRISSTNCNYDPPKNTWLNVCQTPTYSWGSKLVGSIQLVNYELIGTSSSSSGCQVTKPGDLTRCSVCKSKKSLNSSEGCTNIVAANIDCDASNVGVGFSKLATPTVDGDMNKQFSTSLAVRLGLSDQAEFASHSNPLCNKCITDRFLHQGIAEDAYKCGKSDIFPKLSSISNCDVPIYSASNQINGCIICSDNYIYNSESKTCSPQSSYSGCSVLKGTSTVTCTKCLLTHVLVSGACLEHFCEEFENSNSVNYTNSSKCVVCKDNYKLSMTGDTINKHMCVLNNDSSNDICSKYSPNLGHCVKCRDPAKFPYVFMDKGSGSTPSFAGFSCESFSLTGNGFSNYGATYPYLEVQTTDSTATLAVSYVKIAADLKRLTPIELGSPAIKNCFPAKNIAFCSKTINSIFCTECNPKYFVSSKTNTCLPTKIPNCITPTKDDAGCSACIDSKFASAVSPFCTDRTKSTLNCKTLVLNQDKCESCDNTERYLNTAGECVLYTVQNCKVYQADKNLCESCNDKFYKNTSTFDLCAPHTVSNCITFNSTKNNCLTCNANSWKNSFDLSSIKCDLYTVTNCSEKSKTGDSCTACLDNFYSKIVDDSTKCVANTQILNCETYSKVEDHCSKCKDLMYYDSKTQECRNYPDGIDNCRKYNNRTTCTECHTNYYLSSNTCIAVSAANKKENCYTYTSATVCSACVSNQSVVLTEGSCKKTVALNCITYVNENKCKTCKTNYILDSAAGTCTPSGISDCSTASKSESTNICTQCVAGTLPNSAKTTCNSPSPEIFGCADYETVTRCKTCKSNFILSLNRTKCESMIKRLDNNCKNGVVVSTSVCNQCLLGYKKNASGNCELLTYKNCAVENLTDAKCQLCMPGTSMQMNGTCVGGATDGGDGTTPTSVTLVKSVTIFTLLALYLNKL